MKKSNFLLIFELFVSILGTSKSKVANAYYGNHDTVNNERNLSRLLVHPSKSTLLFLAALLCNNMLLALGVWMLAGYFPVAKSDDYDIAFCKLYAVQDGHLVWDDLDAVNSILRKAGAHTIVTRLMQ